LTTEAALADGLDSGAEGARTPDLLAASQTLSQLSYSPSDLVLGGVLYRDFPVVGGRDEPERAT
jgi:hypothetical protein